MSYANGFGKKQGAPAEYIIAASNVKGLYTVAKFLGGDQPVETYAVEMNEQRQQSCQCMAWISKKTRPCKHGGMVQAFQDTGEDPNFFCTGQGKEWTGVWRQVRHDD